eukprot:TRINITY_DN12938_c0_g1_i1.p2 TRINITY_DN12938_c0_g1~~TRINITY_DN12938_c0_g1_i1.p2  ORF type:complete len:291 (+),score=64.88 TRINITY_DN12938_c0_g1_i1:2-874(+)
MKNVEGKIVLVTGGGSGIGRLMALRFAERKAKIVLWDVVKDAMEEVAEEIRKAGGVAFTYVVDVSKSANIYAAAERVKADVGRVDILVNNAGIVSGKPLLDLPDEKIEMTFAVNTLSHFYTCKAFLPAMIAANEGHIVTIASSAAYVGIPRMTDYCSSKWAAFGFNESLRLELAHNGHTGVKTTVICPFYINTGMFEGVRTRFPLLLPILEPDYVADQIINAVLKEKAVLTLPYLPTLTGILRSLLPVCIFDWIGNFLGTTSSMDSFKGRGEEKKTQQLQSCAHAGERER